MAASRGRKSTLWSEYIRGQGDSLLIKHVHGVSVGSKYVYVVALRTQQAYVLTRFVFAMKPLSCQG